MKLAHLTQADLLFRPPSSPHLSRAFLASRHDKLESTFCKSNGDCGRKHVPDLGMDKAKRLARGSRHPSLKCVGETQDGTWIAYIFQRVKGSVSSGHAHPPLLCLKPSRSVSNTYAPASVVLWYMRCRGRRDIGRCMYTCLATGLVPAIVNWSYIHGVLLSRHHLVYVLGSPTYLDTRLLLTFFLSHQAD